MMCVGVCVCVCAFMCVFDEHLGCKRLKTLLRNKTAGVRLYMYVFMCFLYACGRGACVCAYFVL
jgi:hypothetical protein